ncbi:hypothetical protein [Streptomyces genisteinicus]|uniref:Guanylate cyclase domain-containing protein n=1 Tax=Streptomyces genisteinicus TaxID=2768068 RepID=A0A7H0HU77_9ACTN|nr:hypothetical protein [Streptomyces genisteinicus]QNP64093.1 hypothetical protein IAG43_15035 [Streptomyces genisteinicus]
MDDDAREVAEAHYELVISVDARRSGGYDDVDKPRMRARVYRILEGAFTHARVARDALHMEDRGDGALVAVTGRVPVTRLLGLWTVEVHEALRDENRSLRVPLGLRVGMHVGPVRHDPRGISGRAVDLACRLADSPVARDLLDAEAADLVLVVSDSLYTDLVVPGGKFIHPDRWSPARLGLKEGEVTGWFHLPGRPAPAIPEPGGSPDDGRPGEAADGAGPGGEVADDAGPAGGGRAPAPEAGDPGEGRGGDGDQERSGAGGTGDDRREAGAPEAGGPREERGGDQYTVHGDMSRHSGNVYRAPVHIGRVTGDADRRKG